jgi:FliI/YscN family ATPase
MLDPWRESKFPIWYGGCDGWVRSGAVAGVVPGAVFVRLRGAAQGSLIAIETRCARYAFAQIVSVEGGLATCSPLRTLADVAVGARAFAIGAELGSFCGFGLLGRRVDAWGGPPGPNCRAVPIRDAALDPAHRRPISRALYTGIPAIDGLCTIGVGQRVALFSGSGVGKSTLLRLIGAHARLDAHVLALIGERGREAAEAERELAATSSFPKTTIVCATAEAPAQTRLAAMHTAVTQAQWLCERGYHVLLTVDSLTRVAQAWREIALAAGEPPAHRGHPPSLPALLARLVERAGVWGRGSITAIYSVLVDADDLFEPVTDVVRGLLDGHIVLSRSLADSGRYPPIDVLRSSSRVMNAIVSREHRSNAARVRKALAALERAEDLFAIGAYVAGGDPVLDAAVAARERIEDFLFGGPHADALARLAELAALLHP